MGQLSVDLSAKIELLKTKTTTTKATTGISFPRHFTAKLEAGKTPYDEIQWETRTASIGNDKGSVIFEQRDIEVPADWSQTATNIVASKYFYGKPGPRAGDQRRLSWSSAWSTRSPIGARWTATSRPMRMARISAIELAHLMLTQKACFNSPVWFNVGVKEARGYGWYLRRGQGRIVRR